MQLPLLATRWQRYSGKRGLEATGELAAWLTWGFPQAGELKAEGLVNSVLSREGQLFRQI